MERQSKEESQVLWKLELESAKSLNLSEEHATLIEVVSSKIEDYTLTYNEYVQDIHDYLATINGVEEDKDPKTIVKEMCEHLIQKYNGEEIRSEQD